MRYDIITFGSVSQDIFVKANSLKFKDEEGFYLPFDEKIEIKEIIFSSGGGGTNTAATFVKQGFKTAFCGAIGVDLAGLEVVRDLKKWGIDTRLLIKKRGKLTNHSLILLNDDGKRAILTYRGASELVELSDIPWRKIKKTKWFYFAPITGLLCDKLKELVDFGWKNKIRIAMNPSINQLSLPETTLKEIFDKTEILFLNKQEASYLTKISPDKELEIFKKIREFCRGIIVITKGKDGVMVLKENYFYSAPADRHLKVIDTTGAGDSFAAGFLSGYIRFNEDVQKAIQLGMANASANISQIGAKTGILEKDQEFNPCEVRKQKFEL